GGVVLEARAAGVENRRLVQLEVDVAERLLGVELIERLAREELLLGERSRRGRGCRRRRRRRRRRRGRRGRWRRRRRSGRGRRNFLMAGRRRGGPRRTER